MDRKEIEFESERATKNTHGLHNTKSFEKGLS